MSGAHSSLSRPRNRRASLSLCRAAPHRRSPARASQAAAVAAPAQAGEPYTLRTSKGTEPSTLHRIEVAENRAKPKGARITLAVVRLAATAPTSRPPVIYLAGGPGQSGIAAAQISDTYDILERIRRTADVLLLDQRGTGQSVPRLSCPSTHALPADVFASSAAMQRALEPTLRDCLQSWRARGADLAAYNTEASADDVADVAKALNIARLSVFGFSYGTAPRRQRRPAPPGSRRPGRVRRL